MNNTKSRLTACFQIVFPELSAREILNATNVSVANWDSVAMINLISVIEEEFGIEFDGEKLTEMNSYQQILTYIESHPAR